MNNVENWLALYLSIIKKTSVERSFLLLEGKQRIKKTNDKADKQHRDKYGDTAMDNLIKNKIPFRSFYYRIHNRGWSVERASTTPIRNS